MPQRLTIKVFAYNELVDIARKRAIKQLTEREVTDPLSILESSYTETGVYLAPEFFETLETLTQAPVATTNHGKAA